MVPKEDDSFSQMIRAIPDAIIVTHMADQRIIDINPAFSQMSGYSVEEARNLTSAELALWATVDDRAYVWSRLERHEVVENYEAALRTKSGCLKACLLSCAVSRHQGEYYVVSSLKDVSKHKHDKDVLDQRLQFEELLVDLSTRFSNIPASRVDSEIESAMDEILRFMRVDQVGFMAVSADQADVYVTHMRVASGFSEPTNLFGVNLAVLFPWLKTRLVDEQRVVCVRSPEEYPPEAALDRENHLSIRAVSFIDIPIVFGGNVRYLFHVDCQHPRSWPDEHVQRLRVLGELFANALERKHSQEALDHRLRFEALLVNLSSRFANLNPDQVDGDIEAGLTSIREFLDVDGVSFHRVSTHPREVRLTHYSRSEDLGAPEPILGQNVVAFFPWASKIVFEHGQPICLQSIDDCPPEGQADKEIWRQLGIESVLDIPISLGGEVCHLLHVSSGSPRAWPEDYIPRLRLLGEVFANALVRKRLDEDRRRAMAFNDTKVRLVDVLAGSVARQDAVKGALALLGEQYQWDLAGLWKVNRDRNELTLIDDWSCPGRSDAAASPALLTAIALAEHSIETRSWKAREPLWWSRQDGLLPSRDSFTIDQQTTGNFASALAFPISVPGGSEMVFSFYSVRHRERAEIDIGRQHPLVLTVGALLQQMFLREELEHVLRYMPHPVLILDQSGKIRYHNASSQTTLGNSHSELVGQSIEVVFRFSAKDRVASNFLEFVIQDSSPAQTVVAEVLARSNQGNEIPMEICLSNQQHWDGPHYVICAIDLRQKKNHLNMIQNYTIRLRNLARHLQRVLEDQRKSIARDIHDDLGQVLMASKMQLVLLHKRIETAKSSEKSAPDLLSDIDELTDTIEGALTHLSKIVQNLRPEVLDSLGLIAAVQWLLSEFSHHNGIHSDFFSTVDKVEVDDVIATHVFRVVQECLTNVSKHASASHVIIHARVDSGVLHLTIRDDGVGFDTTERHSHTSFGLTGMRERVNSIGGTISIQSEPGDGTTVDVLVPMDYEQGEQDG